MIASDTVSGDLWRDLSTEGLVCGRMRNVVSAGVYPFLDRQNASHPGE